MAIAALLALAAPAGAQQLVPTDPPDTGAGTGLPGAGGDEGAGSGGEGSGGGSGGEEAGQQSAEGEAETEAEPTPFGHECESENGVRFCPTTQTSGSGDDRVPSFDDVPLDVDVTLPPEGDGPFPTIVIMHGYGGSKEDFEAENGSPEGDDSREYHYNNVFYAQRG